MSRDTELSKPRRLAPVFVALSDIIYKNVRKPFK